MIRKLSRFSGLSRRQKVMIQMIADASLVALAFFVAMVLRYDSVGFAAGLGFWIVAAAVGLLTVVFFFFIGLYLAIVRHVTGRVLVTVAKGVLVSAVLLYASNIFFEQRLVPRSVPVIYGFVLFFLIGGARFIIRQVFRQPDLVSRKPVIIFGAGETGLQLLNTLFHGRDYAPIALVDDDPKLRGLTMSGLTVYAPAAIPRLTEQTGARVLLLATPRMSRRRRREIISDLDALQMEIKTVPTLAEMITGKANVAELRTVSAEDLLGRDPVSPVPELLGKNITGKVVMVTGAGGSIGSELCRQILGQGPESLMLFESSEFALYQIEAELTEAARSLGVETKIIPLLGSVQHTQRIEAIIDTFKVQTIYHAAAYKHVPLVEENVVEGIRNNVFGTLTVATAASKFGVENFILVSTDKAVRPTNVMGATKRIAELVCQAQANTNTTTTFSMVRFGNVLGSSGSVIPKFKSQIESGGPVSVTHQDINRYFMTIPEAAQLVIQAGAMAKGGDVFVLDMGKPVKIMDLAFSMIRLHGLIPYQIEDSAEISPEKGDIPVIVTGLRKGEKLYEELLIGNDPAETEHPRIMTASEIALGLDDLMEVLGTLDKSCRRFDLPAIIEVLLGLPLEYAPTRDEVSDVLWAARRIDTRFEFPTLEHSDIAEDRLAER